MDRIRLEQEGVIISADTKQIWKENDKIQKKNDKELMKIQHRIHSMKFKNFIKPDHRLLIEFNSGKSIPGIAYLHNVRSATAAVRKHSRKKLKWREQTN